ncbi:MAG: hypothetical protein EA412_10340 [Chitinophagaceae bacterium]|nr:MAG: hypothetical protein EA412_10340 [Chitinophagaceae bacterium]
MIDSPEENPWGDWNAHLFFLNRRKNLIFVNNKSYYCLIIQDIKKADLKDFESLFVNRLIEQLQFDKIIKPDDALVVFQKLLPLTLTKTNNDKKAIGTMNEYVYIFKLHDTHPPSQGKPLKLINHHINNTPMSAGKQEKERYAYPIEDMKELMKDFR